MASGTELKRTFLFSGENATVNKPTPERIQALEAIIAAPILSELPAINKA